MAAFIQQQNLIRQDYEDEEGAKRAPLWRRILLSNTTKGLVFVTLFAIAIPILLYYVIIDRGTYPAEDHHSCALHTNYMISCGHPNATLNYCNKINCCYDNETRTCYHYMPSKYYYSWSGSNRYSASLTKSPFGRTSMTNIGFTVIEESADYVRFILYDPQLEEINGKTINNKNYEYIKYDNSLSVVVNRTNTSDVLLTTTLGPLIASELYWEWSFQLTDQFLFGFGQLLIDIPENSTLTKVIYSNREDHNTLPVFMAYRNGSYHGLTVQYDGPLEVTILPSKLVSLKGLAGSKIELKLYLGPTPKDIFKQQLGAFVLPEPWTLGVHVCRGGTTTDVDAILDEFETFMQDNANYINQFASDCIHENLAMALFNITDNQKTRLVDNIVSIKSAGLTFILSLPPQIPADSDFYSQLGPLSDVLYQEANQIYNGTYLGEPVVYPNFDHHSTDDLVRMVLQQLGTNLDGLPTSFILNSNWPAEDSHNLTDTSSFQYLSEDLRQALSYTVPWNALSNNKSHILSHNGYGNSHVQAITRNTPVVFLMTASHTPATSNPLLVQNVVPSWTNFKKTITSVLYSSIFTSPLVSAPVCGSSSFNSLTLETLCLRWYLMAATSPIFRVSSDLPRRDPNSLHSLFATNTIREAIDTRKQLEPYFYTILKDGDPLMRPMFYDFWYDNTTFALDEQYMVGDKLLVAHPVLPRSSLIRLYLPVGIKVWYELWGGRPYDIAARNNGWIALPIVENDWISFVPEGAIIPFITTSDSESRAKLVIALNCVGDTCASSGRLWINSCLLLFEASNNTLITNEAEDCIDTKFIIDKIAVYRNDGTPVFKNDLNYDVFNQTSGIKIDG